MGEQYLEAHNLEFLDLVQGSLTMAEYKSKFVQLSKYAPNMVLTKKD